MNEYNMIPQEVSHSTVLGSKKSNLSGAQDKDFKTPIISMFKDLKEDRKNALKTMKTQRVERVKTIQDMRAEFNKETDSPKKTQNEIKRG